MTERHRKTFVTEGKIKPQTNTRDEIREKRWNMCGALSPMLIVSAWEGRVMTAPLEGMERKIE